MDAAVLSSLERGQATTGGAGLQPGNLWRRLRLPQRIRGWSLTSLQHRPMKTGGRLVKHARYYWLLLAESHLNRRLFGREVDTMSPEQRSVRLPGGRAGAITPKWPYPSPNEAMARSRSPREQPDTRGAR